MTDWQVITGDCLEVLPTLPDGIADAIITDLPYGTTACTWDEVIPFAPMWAQVKRLLKPRGAFVTTASQPFTSKLVMSNLGWFRYSWAWDKVNKYTDFANSNHRPMKRHEDILVFSEGKHTYIPQMIAVTPYKSRRSKPSRANVYRKFDRCDYGETITEHHPCSVIAIKSHFTTGIKHPTQKPVALYEYLIRTYTNEGDMVLDFTCGSGTTGVAAINTGRNFIGVELREDYADIARRRCAEAMEQARQMELQL